MIDYDMLFEEGNLVILNNDYENKNYCHLIEPFKNNNDNVDWRYYYNKNLSYTCDAYYKEKGYRKTNFQIMFIIKLNTDKATAEILYSRNDKINKALKEEKMPELKNGDFVTVINDSSLIHGVVVDDKIIYDRGDWDFATPEKWCFSTLIKIYRGCNSFSDMKDKYLIWER